MKKPHPACWIIIRRNSGLDRLTLRDGSVIHSNYIIRFVGKGRSVKRVVQRTNILIGGCERIPGYWITKNSAIAHVIDLDCVESVMLQ